MTSAKGWDIRPPPCPHFDLKYSTQPLHYISHLWMTSNSFPVFLSKDGSSHPRPECHFRPHAHALKKGSRRYWGPIKPFYVYIYGPLYLPPPLPLILLYNKSPAYSAVACIQSTGCMQMILITTPAWNKEHLLFSYDSHAVHEQEESTY